jgi:hypothetical protein
MLSDDIEEENMGMLLQLGIDEEEVDKIFR